MTAYTDGKTGWLMTPQGLQPMPPPVMDQARGEAFRQLIPLVLSDRDASRVVTVSGPQSVQITGPGNQSVTLELGADGLPAKLIYEAQGAGGKPSKIEAVYSDWREVDNVKLPFKSTITQDGRKFGDLVTSELKLNNGFKPEELARKPEAPKPAATK